MKNWCSVDDFKKKEGGRAYDAKINLFYKYFFWSKICRFSRYKNA